MIKNNVAEGYKLGIRGKLAVMTLQYVVTDGEWVFSLELMC